MIWWSRSSQLANGQYRAVSTDSSGMVDVRVANSLDLESFLYVYS